MTRANVITSRPIVYLDKTWPEVVSYLKAHV